MTDDRQRRAAEIAGAAFGKPTVARADYLADACGGDDELRAEVDALLAADAQAGSFLDKPVVRANEAPAIADPLEGSTIGGFRIVRRLAAGGMGVVYEAQQQNPPRRVALKVIRAGAASPGALRRFEHEAHVLARLQHPGIAQVFEAGAFDTGHGTQPFFAMELIDGQSLTTFAESSHLDMRGRLELFARICDAVHYAHQKGVVHRDLKPGNVLVGADGQPKILDFGVAKVTDADVQATTLHTRAGELIGTIPYMSPEQVLGDANAVDTRSDVYALGVVLYELLSGRLPHDLRDKAVPEAARIIREQEITSLSSVSRVFKGDLDTIVARALEKDPDRRYPSAAELAADVRRYLNDEPITARPASAMYQFRKFARRNKAVVIGVAAVFVALLGGAVVATYGLVQAGVERDNAQTESASLAAINEFLKELLMAVNPEEAQGREVTVREVLDEAAARIEEEFTDQPLVEAKVRHTIGDAYASIDAIESADRQFRAALEILRRELGDNDLETLMLTHAVGNMLFHKGRYAEAESYVTRSLEGFTALLGGDHHQTLAALATLGAIYGTTERFEQAERLEVETVERFVRAWGEEYIGTLSAMSNLAGTWLLMGRFDDALQLNLKIRQICERTLGETHPQTLDALTKLGSLYTRMGRLDQAESLLVDTLATCERILGEEHTKTLSARTSLATLYAMLRRYGEAEPLLTEVLEARRRLRGEDHRDTLWAANELAMTYQGLGRYDEAESLLLETLESGERALGEDHSMVQGVLNNLGILYRKTGRQAEAERYYLRTLELNRRTLGEEHPSTLGTMTNLANLYLDIGRLEDAEALYLKSVERKRRVLGISHPWTRGAMSCLILVYTQTDRPELALPLHQEILAYQISTARRQDASATNLNETAWTLLTHPRQELRDADAALVYARRAATLTDHADAAILDTLALALFKTGDVDAAVKIQRLALDLLPEAESREPYETALRQYEDAMTAQSTLAAPDSP